MGNVNKNINLFEGVGERFPDIKVYCKDREESLEFELTMHKNGWTWRSSSKYLIRDDRNIQEVTFYDFDRNDKTFGGRKTKEPGKNVVNYSIDKFGLINKLLNREPSYKPRKFDKTFEAFSFNEYEYGSVAFKVNSMDDIKRIVDVFYDIHSVENRSPKKKIMSELEDYYSDDFGQLLVASKSQDTFDGIYPKDLMYVYSKMDPKVYTVNDLSKFGGAPSYIPRKMNRTLESVNGENFQSRYDTYKQELKRSNFLYVRANSNNEIDNFYEILKKKQNIRFVGLNKEKIDDYKKNIDYYENECFYFSFAPNSLGGFDIGYVIHDKNGLSTYPQWMMNMNDYHMLRLLFGIDLAPNYEPKRIKRTFESVDRKEYKYVVVQVENETETNEVLNMLRSISSNFVSSDYDMKYPNWLFIIPKKEDGRYSRVLKWSFNSNQEDAFGYIKNNPEVDPKIYNVKDLLKIKGLITGLRYEPSYEPKRIERTLESVNGLRPEKNLTIKIYRYNEKY